MRPFLMGGTSLVGSRVVRRLLERKDQIVLRTRRPEVARELLLRGEQPAARLLRLFAGVHAALAEALVARPSQVLSGAEVRRLARLALT